MTIRSRSHGPLRHYRTVRAPIVAANCLLLAVAGLGTVLGAGCGARPAAAHTATHPRLPPATMAAQHAVLDKLGQRLHRAIADDRVGDLWFDDLGLRALLSPERASASAVARLNQPDALRVPPLAAQVFAAARYTGVCVQRMRVEPAGGPLGLREPGWAVERLLVVATEAGGGDVAAWVEGEFLLTDIGIGAVWIDRVEGPRRDHADLELAVCDLRVGAW